MYGFKYVHKKRSFERMAACTISTACGLYTNLNDETIFKASNI